MTTLKFVGILPIGIGLLLAATALLLVWRYYARESFDLPGRLKWGLPLLRSLAFCIGIMTLTGPVLHHRQTTGELGKVHIYLDHSQSMTLRDEHLALPRKLLITDQLGWDLDEQLLNICKASRKLSSIQSKLESIPQLSDVNTESESQSEQTLQVSMFVERLQGVLPLLTDHFQKQLQEQVITPFQSLGEQRFSDENREQFEQALSELDKINTALNKEITATLEQVATPGETQQGPVTQFDETSRWRRVELALLGRAESVIDQLRQRHDVTVTLLQGNETTPFLMNEELYEGGAEQSAQATGSTSEQIAFSAQTDLASGIINSDPNLANDAQAEEQTEANAAYVMLTDGNHNSGSSPIQMARLLSQKNTKLYPIAIGAETPATDLALTGIDAPESVFKTDTVRGNLTIQENVPAGQKYLVQVDQGGEVLWQEEVISEQRTDRNIEFEFQVDQLGSEDDFATDVVRQIVHPLALNAQIIPLADERTTENNIQKLHLGVVTESQRVLILDGRSRWETRYLKNVFERDEQWEVTTLLSGPGTDVDVLPRGDQADQFPTSRDDLFQYHLIILGDLPVTQLQQQELERIKDFVEVRGGGLILIDGLRGNLSHYVETELKTVLPVEWPAVASVLPANHFQLTEQGAKTAALRLAQDETENREFWSQLPPPKNVTSVSALPNTQTLVEVSVGGDTWPVIVTGRSGAGRVLYFAFDETWRWRYKAADTWHQRFWNQIAQYAMPQPFSVSDDYLSLDTGSVRYAAGDVVPIRAQLNGVDGRPLSGATTEARIWKDGVVVATVQLQGDSEIPGRYTGTSVPLDVGEYEVTFRASGFSDSAFKAKSQFVVQEDQSVELSTTSANFELLQNLAEQGEGEFLLEEEISRLPEILNPLSQGKVIETETALWQSYYWFILIVALLTAEWILRKRAGLL